MTNTELLRLAIYCLLLIYLVVLIALPIIDYVRRHRMVNRIKKKNLEYLAGIQRRFNLDLDPDDEAPNKLEPRKTKISTTSDEPFNVDQFIAEIDRERKKRK